MRLLFDENLSFRLSERLSDPFPRSSRVRLLGLDRAPDERIWETAKREGYVIVTQDVDFVSLSLFKRATAQGRLAPLWESTHGIHPTIGAKPFH